MKILIPFLVALFLFVTSASAADLEVTCDSTGCANPSSQSLFPSTQIWFPGKSLTRSIRVTNTGGEPLTVFNHTSNITNFKDLDSIMTLKIDRLSGGPSLFEDFLTIFYSSGSVSLSTIDAGSSDEYRYTVSMNPEAGNEFQKASTKFDLLLNFAVSDATEATPIVLGISTNKSHQKYWWLLPLFILLYFGGRFFFKKK